MDDKILIATIAVIGSVVVALVSLIASIINSRIARKTSHSLELLKDQIALNNKAAEIADEEFHKAIEGLKKAIEVIQVVKDEIYMILHAPEESVLSSEIIQKFSAFSEKVASTYGEFTAHLSESEYRSLHRAKNIALQLRGVIIESFSSTKYTSESEPPAFEMLQKFHDQLSELQVNLRDNRADRILEKTIVKSSMELK